MKQLHPQAIAFNKIAAQHTHPETSEVSMEQARLNDEWLLDYIGDLEEVGERASITIAGPGGEVPVEVYRPDVDGLLPVLCYFHGGGWAVWSTRYVEALCRSLANAAQCVVASVEYRLAPEHPFPAGLDDCYACVEWTQTGAAEFGGDPTRIAVGGESAGGNLAAACAIRARDSGGPNIGYQLLLYPTTDSACDAPSFADNAEYGVGAAEMRWFWEQYIAGGDIRDPLAAVQYADLRGLPPAYVLTAELDTLRDEAETFATLLRDAGVTVTSRRFLGHQHGFITAAAVLDDARVAIDDASRYLAAALKR